MELDLMVGIDLKSEQLSFRSGNLERVLGL